MLILLPPSEGKATPVRGKPLDLDDLSFPELTADRTAVLTALVRLCGNEPALAAKTLGLGSTQIDEVRRNQLVGSSPTARADAIYTGVLYESLDLGSLDRGGRHRAARSVAITSSLFGLVRPGDRIPAYRLAGGVNLPGLGGVGTYWRGVLDPIVRQAAGAGLIVDLRSSTYAAFWRPDPDLGRQVVHVRVLHQSGSQRKVVSHFNKATKGRLLRALLEAGSVPGTPVGLADQIAALGWKVELEQPQRTGHRLDVIVEKL